MASSHHFTQPRQVSGRLAPPVMLCCSAAPASSSTPLRPSVHYPSISLVVKLMFIQTFCDHLNVIIFSIRQTCIVLKSGWSSTARIRASSLVLLPSLPLPPRRHRQADGQLSPLYPPSPSFSSCGAVYVKLSCLLPPSLVRNTCLCIRLSDMSEM